MSKTVGEYLSENIDDVKRLAKVGIVSNTVINNFSVYNCYKSLNTKSMPSKMDRYQFTADSLKISQASVRLAIQIMEKPMK